MGFEDFLEIKNLIKFGVLGIGLIVLVFVSTDIWKWRILLSAGGLIGLVIALSGATLGSDHGFGRKR